MSLTEFVKARAASRERSAWIHLTTTFVASGVAHKSLSEHMPYAIYLYCVATNPSIIFKDCMCTTRLHYFNDTEAQFTHESNMNHSVADWFNLSASAFGDKEDDRPWHQTLMDARITVVDIMPFIALGKEAAEAREARRKQDETEGA